MKKVVIPIAVIVVLVVGAMLISPAGRDELHWMKANRTNSESAYKAYLEHWPDGRHVNEAVRLGHTCAWRDAKAANTFEAYQAYIKSYPDGQYVKQAKHGALEQAWVEAEQRNTITGFQEYIKRYPSIRLDLLLEKQSPKFRSCEAIGSLLLTRKLLAQRKH